MNNVVIAVITCKRPEWLARLLDSLIALQYEASISPQILVVDNDSAGSSRDVVITRQQNASMPVTYDVEKKQGIVFARNRCVERFLEMDGDYLVFIDDDEWPQQSDWLNRLVNAASEFNVDVVTSHVISVGEPGTPDRRLHDRYRLHQHVGVQYRHLDHRHRAGGRGIGRGRRDHGRRDRYSRQRL